MRHERERTVKNRLLGGPPSVTVRFFGFLFFSFFFSSQFLFLLLRDFYASSTRHGEVSAKLNATDAVRGA